MTSLRFLNVCLLGGPYQRLCCVDGLVESKSQGLYFFVGQGLWVSFAVATNLGNTKLERIIKDPYSSISKKVTEIGQALEHANAKTLLGNAGQTIAKVKDAEVWTTVLRDRRNALHWRKAKSFIADHSETSSLLMAAPLHIGTLEATRAAC